MRLDQPNQSQSIFKRLASLLLAAVCLSLAGCHLWYQDMKGYLEYWTGAVSIGNVSWSASPDSQKDSSGVDTVSTNATVTASAGIINPSQYPLDGGIGSASESRRSVRISGDAGSAALANASVTSSSFTSMAVEIQPLSQVPTPASLALEHKNFTMEFIPTRSDNALSSASTHSLTLRYNTPPRMPLEVMEYSGSLKFLDGTKQWEVVTGSSTIQLNDLIFWAWPSGIADPTHPDYVVKFEVYEDGVLFDEYTPQECLMSGQTNLQSFVPQDLKNAGYNIYYSLASTGTEITIYAVDSEGVRSLATTSGRAPHAITLDANGGSFAGSDIVTVYRTEGSTLNGGDLDIPTRSGFYLSGWTVSGTPVTFPHTVSAPVAFTAQWTANPSSGGGGGEPSVPDKPDTPEDSDNPDVPGGEEIYTVKYNLDGGANPADAVTDFTVEELPVELPVPTKAGYTFEGWYDSVNLSGTAFRMIESVGDKEYWAKWEANSIDGISANAPTYSDIAGLSTPRINGSTLVFTSPAGYSKYKWFLDDEEQVSTQEFVMDVNTVAPGIHSVALEVQDGAGLWYSARYDIAVYAIDYNCNGGQLSGNSVPKRYVTGMTVTLPTASDLIHSGYTFDGWYERSDFSGNSSTAIATDAIGSRYYHAKWRSIGP